MSYQSPYKLLSGIFDDVTHIDQDMLLRLRKKLLAEFDLHNSTTIRLNNREYTKDEVLKLIDGFREISDHEMHLKIFRHPDILAFLEDPIANQDKDGDVFDWLKDDANGYELKDLLIRAEQDKLRHLFSRNNFPSLIEFYQKVYTLEDEMLAMSFDEPLIRYHHHTLELLRQAYQEKTTIKAIPAHLQWSSKSGWAKFYNLIGQHHVNLIYEMANVMINFSVYLYEHCTNRDEAILVSWQLRTLVVDGEAKRIILSNHVAFENRPNKKKDSQYSWAIYIVIFVIILVVRIALMSNNRSKRYRYDDIKMPNFQYNYTPPANYDSIFEALDSISNSYQNISTQPYDLNEYTVEPKDAIDENKPVHEDSVVTPESTDGATDTLQ